MKTTFAKTHRNHICSLFDSVRCNPSHNPSHTGNNLVAPGRCAKLFGPLRCEAIARSVERTVLSFKIPQRLVQASDYRIGVSVGFGRSFRIAACMRVMSLG